VDPRTPAGTIHPAIPSLDEGSGVRSILWQAHVLTIGGGAGRISFYDLRANGYLDLNGDTREDIHNIVVDPVPSPVIKKDEKIETVLDTEPMEDEGRMGVVPERRLNDPPTSTSALVGRREYFQTGAGYLDPEGRELVAQIRGLNVRNAVYTMSHDDSGRRLLSAGGPLQLGLRGSYVALWE
jgi:hypothetical protein